MRAGGRFAIIVFFGWVAPALAAERFETYNGVRSLAMGGASVAIVNDETALVSNPAALGKLRDYFVTVLDPEVEMSNRTVKMVGLGVLQATEPQSVLDALNESPDRDYYYRNQIFPSLVLPNFGAGFLGKTRVAAQLNGANMEIDYQRDYAFVFGFNFRLWDGRIKLGFNTRITDRTEIKNDAVPSNSTGLETDTLAAAGVGVGSDVGLLLAMPWAWLPTFGFVYRDVGSTKFDFRRSLVADTTTYPATQKPTLDVALAVYPILGRSTRSTWTVELRDALYSETESGAEAATRRTHIGYEINLNDIAFVRLGLGQGYLSYGGEIAIGNYQFQIASYGEEVGTDDAKEQQRRLAVKFAYRF